MTGLYYLQCTFGPVCMTLDKPLGELALGPGNVGVDGAPVEVQLFGNLPVRPAVYPQGEHLALSLTQSSKGMSYGRFPRLFVGNVDRHGQVARIPGALPCAAFGVVFGHLSPWRTMAR